MYVYTNRQRCTTVWGRAQGPLHTASLPHWLSKCNCWSSRGAAQWVIVYVHGQSRQRDQKHLRQGATRKATPEQRIQWGEQSRWITRGAIHVHGYRGTGNPAAMNPGWHHSISQQQGYSATSLSLSGLRHLQWDTRWCEDHWGDLVFPWGNTKFVETRERGEDLKYEKK